MRAKWITVVAMAAYCGIVLGQSATVTATIVDSDSQAWVTQNGFNAKYTIQLINSTTGAPIPGGQAYRKDTGATITNSFSGNLDGTGAFSVSLTEVSYILPSNVTWQFTVCPAVSSPTCGTVNIPVNASGSVSAQINAVISAPRITGGAGAFAYADVEVAASPNNTYYNTTTPACRYYSTSWGVCGSGAGGPPTGAAGGALAGNYPNPTLNPSIVGANLALTAASSTNNPISSFSSSTGSSSDTLLTEWNVDRLYLGYYGSLYTSTPGFLADVTGGKAIANTIACTIPFTSPLGTCSAATILDATGFGIGTVVGAASGQPFNVTPAGVVNAAGAVNANGGLNVSSGAAIAGNATVAGSLSATGGITATPDGVHAGYDSLAGNTATYSVASTTAGWMGPPSTSFTAYALQLPATGPTSSLPFLSCATPTSGVSACSFVTGGITWPATADIVLSNSTNSPAGLAPINGDCVVGSGGAWTASSCSGSAAWSSVTNGANTQTGAFSTVAPWTWSYAGTASTPSVEVSGVPYAGTDANSYGTLDLTSGSAASIVTLNTAGTYMTIRQPTSGTADLVNFFTGTQSEFKVSSGGTITANGGLSTTTGAFGSVTSTGIGNNLIVPSSATITHETTSALQFAGSSGVGIRLATNGGTSTTLTVGDNYGAFIVGASVVTTPATGTNAWLANLVVVPIGTLTSGGATITNMTNAYIGAAPTGGVNNYSLYVAGPVAANSVQSPSFQSTAAQTTVSCSTSGSAIFSEPEQGASDKKVLIHLAACLGTASYTYPTAFTNTPSAYASNNVATSIATTVSTTAVTVTGATTTGSLVLEDY